MSTREGIVDAIQLLTVRKMAGKPECLEALLSYVEGKISPSEASIYGVTRNQLRGLMQRVREKVGNPFLADIVVKRATPIILRKTPIKINNNGSVPRCLICRKPLIKVLAEDHIIKCHRNLVYILTREVMEEMRRSMGREKMG